MSVPIDINLFKSIMHPFKDFARVVVFHLSLGRHPYLVEHLDELFEFDIAILVLITRRPQGSKRLGHFRLSQDIVHVLDAFR